MIVDSMPAPPQRMCMSVLMPAFSCQVASNQNKKSKKQLVAKMQRTIEK